ncbi:MAG: phosphoglucomutase/phosphomannomutase family protein [Patescibacteria group bacterium]|jgi:phosphomannomutase
MNIKFGTDGWRGIIDKDFDEENVKLATQAIAKFFIDNGKKSVVIGYDGRRKADIFANTVAEVMAGNGIKVYLVDKPCPSPVAGYAVIDKGADGGIMLTASHNPPEFLGLKYITEKVMVAPTEVTDQFIKNLEDLELADVKLGDKIEIFDPKPAYVVKIKSLVDIEKIKNFELKVLLNPMNGAGVGYLEEMLKGGKIQIETINNEVKPDFGGKHPEPIVEKNVTDAIEKMKSDNFDVCLSSDGDADRIGLIDENGKMITSLEGSLLLVYYLVVVKGQKGPIVETLSNTVMGENLCKKYNLDFYEVKVGFKYVGEKMAEVGAIWGGEESGGSAIKDFIPYRDAQLMNLLILDLMVEKQRPISEILEIAKKEAGGGYQFRREDVHFEYDQYEKIKNTQAAELTKNPPKEVLGRKVARTRDDDGLKIYFEDGSWLLIRFSGTEPVLRLYAEAKTMTEVDKFINYAKEYFG